jgi:hypothetical protein
MRFSLSALACEILIQQQFAAANLKPPWPWVGDRVIIARLRDIFNRLRELAHVATQLSTNIRRRLLRREVRDRGPGGVLRDQLMDLQVFILINRAIQPGRHTVYHAYDVVDERDNFIRLGRHAANFLDQFDGLG